jgi:hypothetical protein
LYRKLHILRFSQAYHVPLAVLLLQTVFMKLLGFVFYRSDFLKVFIYEIGYEQFVMRFYKGIDILHGYIYTMFVILHLNISDFLIRVFVLFCFFSFVFNLRVGRGFKRAVKCMQIFYFYVEILLSWQIFCK